MDPRVEAILIFIGGGLVAGLLAIAIDGGLIVG